MIGNSVGFTAVAVDSITFPTAIAHHFHFKPWVEPLRMAESLYLANVFFVAVSLGGWMGIGGCGSHGQTGGKSGSHDSSQDHAAKHCQALSWCLCLGCPFREGNDLKSEDCAREQRVSWKTHEEIPRLFCA
jgi:hypothetical protein